MAAYMVVNDLEQAIEAVSSRHVKYAMYARIYWYLVKKPGEKLPELPGKLTLVRRKDKKDPVVYRWRPARSDKDGSLWGVFQKKCPTCRLLQFRAGH